MYINIKQHLSNLQLFVYTHGKHAGTSFSCAYLHLKPGSRAPLWTSTGHILPISHINHTKAGLTRDQVWVDFHQENLQITKSHHSEIPWSPAPLLSLLSLQDLWVLAEWQPQAAGVPAHLPDIPHPKALTVGAAGQGY